MKNVAEFSMSLLLHVLLICRMRNLKTDHISTFYGGAMYQRAKVTDTLLLSKRGYE